MNLNEFAIKITKEEGKLRSLPIGQVKEVIRLVLTEVAYMPYSEVSQLLKRYE